MTGLAFLQPASAGTAKAWPRAGGNQATLGTRSTRCGGSSVRGWPITTKPAGAPRPRPIGL